jgi:hypothetical protein
MRTLSATAAKLLALSALTLVLTSQPALATPKLPSDAPSFGSVIRAIVRHVRELTDISFPPG